MNGYREETDNKQKEDTAQWKWTSNRISLFIHSGKEKKTDSQRATRFFESKPRFSIHLQIKLAHHFF